MIDFKPKTNIQFTPTSSVIPVTVKEKPKSLLRKVGDFFTTSEQNLAKTYGAAMSVVSPSVNKNRNTVIEQAKQQSDNYIKLAQSTTDKVKKQNYLKAAMKVADTSGVDIFQNPEYQKTIKQVLGESVGVLADIVGAGSFGKAGVGALVQPKPFLKTALKGATIGAAWGGVGSGAFAAQENKSIGDIAKSSAFGVGAGAVLGGLVLPAASGAINKTREVVAPSVELLTGKVRTSFLKGVKPLLSKMKTPERKNQYLDNAIEAVNLISSNKDRIKLPDTQTGELITGKTPKNLSEFAEAISQAKALVFNSYDEMAKKSAVGRSVDGIKKPGTFFSTLKISQQLNDISRDVGKSPEIRKYAQGLIKEVSELRGQSASVIQERIKDLNNSLSGFYEGRVSKAKAQVDASVANKLREELDSFVERVTGQGGYGKLKSLYGSLKTIENDVNRRALAVSRLNEKSLLGGFTDVFSGGELVHGIISMNPALIAKGLGMKAAAQYVKYLNSSDRQIKLLFNTIDRANNTSVWGKHIDKAVNSLNKTIK